MHRSSDYRPQLQSQTILPSQCSASSTHLIAPLAGFLHNEYVVLPRVHLQRLLSVRSDFDAPIIIVKLESVLKVLVSVRAPPWLALAAGGATAPLLSFDYKAVLRRAALVVASLVLVVAVWLYRDLERANHE